MGTDPSYYKGPNRPVELVSWDECHEFCVKLTAHWNGRGAVELPTEAQWEWACRAGTATDFHFGDVPSTDRFNYSVFWTVSKEGTSREQTTDEYVPYTSDERTDPVGKSEKSGDIKRVMRGGSYASEPKLSRSACRCWDAPADHVGNYGFRVCFRLD
jgi:formylglycine-generating enzyme required for sulfatase activity